MPQTLFFYETTMVLGNIIGMNPKPGSMGKPVPLYDVQILRADGTPAELGETGEICIKTSDRVPCGLFIGYFNNPEKTAEVFVQNPLNKAYPELIYRTGDIGRINERGELVFVSRKDSQIKHWALTIDQLCLFLRSSYIHTLHILLALNNNFSWLRTMTLLGWGH